MSSVPNPLTESLADSPSQDSVTSTNVPPHRGRTFWVDLLLLTLLFCVSYLPRITSLPLRGEETRRARIAWEMRETGNYTVPMLQAEPRLIKPPFHNWMIDLSARLCGGYNRFSIRLPSLIAVIGVALLLYCYANTFWGRVPAFASSLVWLTMGQVLQLGRLAETDLLFAALFASSMIVWHWGEIRGRSLITWPLAYQLAVAAFLTKGIQVPVYLAGSIGLYLILTLRWKRLFAVSHGIAILAGAAVMAPWVMDFVNQLGWDGLHTLYLGEVGERVSDHGWGKFISHLIELPLEVFGATLFPWSLLLLAYCFASVRKQLLATSTQRDLALFSLIVCAVAWPTVWLPVNSSTRYLLPIYPFIALLMGNVLGVLWTQATETSTLNLLWKRNVMAFGVILTTASIAGIGFSLWAPYSPYAQPLWQLLLIGSLGGVLVCEPFFRNQSFLSTLFQPQSRTQTQAGLIVLLTVSVMLGPFLNVLIHRSPNADVQISELKQQLPAEAQLVSYGLLHHLFLYHFEDHVQQHPWPKSITSPQQSTALEEDAIVQPGEYFCFHHKRMNRELPQLEFGWELVSVINCDRTIKSTPYDLIVVGKRTDTPPDKAPRIARWAPNSNSMLSTR